MYFLSPEQVKNIEERRDQTQSKIRFQQQAGRVIASRLKSAVHIDITQLSKFILLPEESPVYIPCYNLGMWAWSFCFWACKQKDGKHYTDFSISKSRLCVHHLYPFMDVSPDGIVTCSCCGKGALEIKCPYLSRDKSLLEKSNKFQFFLEADQDVTHLCHCQVQAQLKFVLLTSITLSFGEKKSCWCKESILMKNS